MATRRVLHLIDTPGPGGAETVFLELVRRLPSKGWESVPVVSSSGWLTDSLRSSGFEPVPLPSVRSIDLTYLIGLRRLLRNRIDIVQTHLLGTSVYAALACLAGRGTDPPVVSTFHGRPDIRSSERFRNVKVRLVRRNHLVCVSESLKRYFTTQGDFPDNAVVIPNGVGAESPSARPRGLLRSELGIGHGVHLVGAVGNIRSSKAYHILIKAFVDVRAAVPRAQLVIAGQADQTILPTLIAQRDRTGLRECVHFLGFRDDVGRILGDIDVFALSSTDEGFSLATLEAMAMGVPVVATRSGGPEEIVGDTRAALLVPPNDSEALGAAIVRLLQSPSLASSIAAAARQRARAFSVESMVEHYAALYEEILQSR